MKHNTNSVDKIGYTICNGTMVPNLKDIVAYVNDTFSQEVQSDWAQTDPTDKSFIKNKPTLSAVATSGSYNDLLDKPTLSTVASTGSYNDLLNKPTITNPKVTIVTAESRAQVRYYLPNNHLMLALPISNTGKGFAVMYNQNGTGKCWKVVDPTGWDYIWMMESGQVRVTFTNAVSSGDMSWILLEFEIV